ncbi:MAG: tetratricopeptide repeat protein, partial [Cyclobacteriaceae bacterium]|nr:tetratricopeptide repeat protein [Cyclobacteriaceae bacterium]
MVNAKSIFAVLILFLFIDAGICQQSNRINAYKNSPQKNLAIARILIGNNAEDSALVFLNAYLSKRFDNREALFLRARIYSNQKIFDKALTDYNSLISLNPENKEALYSRGIIRYQLSLFELALNDFLDVLKLPDGETQTAFFKIDAGSNTAS